MFCPTCDQEIHPAYIIGADSVCEDCFAAYRPGTPERGALLERFNIRPAMLPVFDDIEDHFVNDSGWSSRLIPPLA